MIIFSNGFNALWSVFDMMGFWWFCLTTNFQVHQDSHLSANRQSYTSMSQLMLDILASMKYLYHVKCSEEEENSLPVCVTQIKIKCNIDWYKGPDLSVALYPVKLDDY